MVHMCYFNLPFHMKSLQNKFKDISCLDVKDIFN